MGKPDYYSLSSAEYDSLQAWINQLEEPQGEVGDELHGVTGESSVILSPERYVPSDGILIEKPQGSGEHEEE